MSRQRGVESEQDAGGRGPNEDKRKQQGRRTEERDRSQTRSRWGETLKLHDTMILSKKAIFTRLISLGKRPDRTPAATSFFSRGRGQDVDGRGSVITRGAFGLYYSLPLDCFAQPVIGRAFA